MGQDAKQTTFSVYIFCPRFFIRYLKILYKIFQLMCYILTAEIDQPNGSWARRTIKSTEKIRVEKEKHIILKALKKK